MLSEKPLYEGKGKPAPLFLKGLPSVPEELPQQRQENFSSSPLLIPPAPRGRATEEQPGILSSPGALLCFGVISCKCFRLREVGKSCSS